MSIVLKLADLSCQHCVKSVKKTVDAIEGVEHSEVSLTEAIITGNVDAQVLIKAIVEAGYQAELADSK
ncbi:copper chaperone CopZ [Bisgaardia hudsonensis]|uniref:Copper chaperone CopZ n=1 Tax=Bisgaardia hudsonensis TaxID=109472 RepID=A0A4V6NQ89_9PAST|nr:cation transporter [Bisgaardia hudsonensis]TCP13331.1 copper chaperone CopZ [Bisgaardia hudsonensis]